MRLAVAIFLATIIAIGASPVGAQGSANRDAPPQVQEFVKLLGDPAVRDWIERQRGDAAADPARRAEASSNLSSELGERFAAIRRHFAAMSDALPRLPAEIGQARDFLRRDLGNRGLLSVIVLLGGFVALGFGCQWLFIRAMSGYLRHIAKVSFDTVGERVRAILLRLAFGFGVVASTALGTLGAFLLFDWPPVLREIVLIAVTAFLGQRMVFVACMILLSPLDSIERFRIVPMTMPAARFWHRRILALAAFFAVGAVILNSAETLGLSEIARLLMAYVFDLGVLGSLLEMTLRRPEPPTPRARLGRGAVTWLVAGFFVLLYFLRVANAMGAFWVLLFVVALPAVISVTQRSINHILRPPGAADASMALPSVRIVAFERGMRTALIIGAAWLLVRAWDVNLTALTEGDSTFTRLVRGALSAVVILLLADFTWQVIKTSIDRALAGAQAGGEPDSEASTRQARLRTLLPILRNVVFVVLAAFAVMMALSALGVEIGPLIAGAGVVGVAVGFGAQTLVRDVLSGMFYLLDDAFRTGEYIQAGSFKGTVESFSLRSVKLRHHRGPLYTIPFGALGAVQNMSRDWVIDKFSVGVTYDTDLELVKKLVKQIGKDLSRDPELAPHIIEPLKMQGVEQFGDFAIQVRMKIMTKPGEQFVIRRRAFALIKKAFDANGVKFAFPTVQIAGGEDPVNAAVGRQALELVKPAPT